MPNKFVPAAATGLPSVNRRSFLGGVAMVAIPSATVMISAAPKASVPRVDDFLAKAMPSEKVRYHSNALAEALAEMHPNRTWRSHVDHEHCYSLIVGDVWKGEPA